MRIAVFEYLCCGGLSSINSERNATDSDSLPIAELTREGQLMLYALATDLAACGHRVTTCLDPVICKPGFLAGQSVIAQPISARSDWLGQWVQIGLDCDLAIVIAPELDGILTRVLDTLRQKGVVVLAPDADFVEASSDKYTTSKWLQGAGIATPRTWTLEQFLTTSDPRSFVTPGSNVRTMRDSEEQFVLKRRDGAGCAEMKRFSTRTAMTNWIEGGQYVQDEWIVQPWVLGRAASMAVIAHDGALHVVGAMEQNIRLLKSENEGQGQDVVYAGGAGPIASLGEEQLEPFTTAVIRSMPGKACGWIGIDFVIPEIESSKIEHDSYEWTVIEINPRLTTSYLGYRQWYGHQIANVLLDQIPLNAISVANQKPRIQFSSI